MDFAVGPFVDQRVADAEQDGAEEDTEQAEGQSAAEDAEPRARTWRLPVHVVFLDGHNASPMDSGWRGLFEVRTGAAEAALNAQG